MVNDCRDLGGHLTAAGKKRSGKTLTARIDKAAACAHCLGHRPGTFDTRARVLRTKVSQMGLHGCEITPVNDNAMRTLRDSSDFLRG